MSFNLYSINTGFCINSSGYVGILNMNPKYPLDVSGNCGISNNLNIGGNLIGPNSFVSKNETGNFITKNIYGDVVLTGDFSGGYIISENNGYGAGIYTFQKEISPNASGNIFLISGENNAPAIFDVSISSRFIIGKKYSVIHTNQGNTINYLKIQTDTITYPSYTFDVNFISTGNGIYTGLSMNIKNTYTTNQLYTVTVFLGGSPQKIGVKEL